MGTQITNRQSAIDFLFGRINYERTSQIPYQSNEFRLDRMRKLMSLLGDPHLKLDAIHIAGTKGKGSCSSTIATVLRAAGKRVGLYSSPHLEKIEERFDVNGSPCSEAELIALAETLQQVVEKMDSEGDSPTFFEVVTAMSFQHFNNQNVDLAVLEVGLGGRLDSTNICKPVVTAITSISYDHMRQLGNTLAQIAAEKAGTIKQSVPVVTGVTETESIEVIRRIAAEKNAPLLEIGRDFGFQYNGSHLADAGLSSKFDYWETNGDLGNQQDLQLAMAGEHQVANAAVATRILSQLQTCGHGVDSDALRRGLTETCCPARIEVVATEPLSIIDSAHNPASADALVKVIQEALPNREGVLVLAANQDKDVPAILSRLLPTFSKCILTKFDSNPRAMPVDSLAEMVATIQSNSALPNIEVFTEEDTITAWEKARTMATHDSYICATGSFFLAAELRSHIRNTA